MCSLSPPSLYFLYQCHLPLLLLPPFPACLASPVCCRSKAEAAEADPRGGVHVSDCVLPLPSKTRPRDGGSIGSIETRQKRFLEGE